ncbi:MAG: Oxygen sensor histidine kinase NreB [Candidatus Accumulibacter appositus]|uniref:Oxygen sensor histidine kinase NreB n=1 Tax=Candidatus Accumulibacter appositus TaxID=1454003 RepID=A0A011PP92_9PROT|nr:GAF domain-containing protein [Accumulibacter sp.]EXI78705.1 MAG: Oxygen sensor histidine kinase NreB [Candidatus Accumulibacter appositus]HRF03364.1 GAF domain-containing protein [Accumulibacter sp.]
MNTSVPAGKRILIVEDDSLVAQALALRLAALGYAVAGPVASGEEAVAAAARDRPDLVLMDIVLPGAVDGIDAARVIVGEQRVPLLYLTAYDDEERFARARVTAPHAYLIKPYNDRELQLAIELALQRHQHEALLHRQAERQERRIDELAATLEALVEGSTDCIFAKDLDGRYLLCNRAFEDLLGRQREGILGHGDEDFFPAATAARLRAEDQRLLSAAATETCEEVLADAEGGQRTYLTTKGCLQIAGETVGIFAIARDISERKDAERRLRRLSGFFNALAQTNQAIMHSRSVEALLASACEIVVRHGEVDGAWIGLLDGDGWIRVVADSGMAGEYLRGLRISIDAQRAEGHGPDGAAMRADRPAICNDFVSDPRTGPWQERARAAGLAASAVFPIHRGGAVVGVLSLYAGEVGYFDEELIELLAELASDVSFALDKFSADERRQRAEAELRSALERLHEVSARLIGVQEDERRRLARDLHDDIGQNLTMIKIVLLGMTRWSESEQLEEIREAADIADRTLQRVRALSVELRPPQLDDLGLVAALRAHLDNTCRQAGLEARFVADDALPRLPENAAIAFFRITQEALNNIVRHARATVVVLELRLAQGALTLSVRDDGCGFDAALALAGAARGKSLGLLSMQERAALAGGHLELLSEPAQRVGSELRVTLPLSGES